jgi:beta-glucosidase
VVNSKAHRQLALEAARQSIVLVKNAKNTLPLSKSLKSIFVCGPSAAQVRYGDYTSRGGNVNNFNNVPLLEGIRKIVDPDTIVRHRWCTGILEDLEMNPIHWFNFAEGHIVGEYFGNTNFSGQPVLTRNDAEVNFNFYVYPPAENVPKLFSVRWTAALVADATVNGWLGIQCNDPFKLFINGKLFINATVTTILPFLFN